MEKITLKKLRLNKKPPKNFKKRRLKEQENILMKFDKLQNTLIRDILEMIKKFETKLLY